MGQLSIILIVGFLCLFAYESPESIGTIDTAQTFLWNIVLIFGPIFIAYLFTVLASRVSKSQNTFTRNVFSHLGLYRICI